MEEVIVVAFAHEKCLTFRVDGEAFIHLIVIHLVSVVLQHRTVGRLVKCFMHVK